MKTSIFVLALAGCTGSGRPEPAQIFANREAGYSVGHPGGWTTSNDRGAIRFSPANGKQTIVIRSAPRPAQIVEGKPTSNGDVVDATRKVLQRVTRDPLAEPSRVADAELPGVRFSFTFRPQSVHADYRRDHVVLFGDRHLFHVIRTAPVGEVLDDKAMQEIVTTLTEEG